MISEGNDENENNYGQALAYHAYTKIENEYLLSEAIEGIRLYNRDAITKTQLNEFYDNVCKKVLILQRLEQIGRNNENYINLLKSLCDKTRIKSPNEIRFADDIFKRILSYCIDDDKFKVNTTSNNWLNKVIMKNVRVQPISCFELKIIDDITKSNKYKIVEELSRIKERIFSPQGEYGLYDSYTADIKFKYCENETSFYYVTRLEKRRDIVTKYTLHDITDDICIYRFLAY